MFSALSPIGRMRSSGCKLGKSDGGSSRSVLSQKSSTLSPQRNGDYDVLRNSVDEQRKAVHESRSVLAAALDRLGEHHVRNKEYDDAMDAFTEALHEKRSVFAQIVPTSPLSSAHRSRTSSNSDSLFDMDTLGPEIQELHDVKVDEIVKTLRNMGNVHSLRGEQDEAMRYYTEVTSLRATKASNRDAISIDSKSRSSFSGMWGDEDNSTLMSEINEDVKALDDLFRSISFRNGEAGVDNGKTERSKPLTPATDNVRKRRREDDLRGRGTIESEPFKRSSSLGLREKSSSCSSLCESDQALDTYRLVLDSYQGSRLDQHYEHLNSFVLRADLLTSNLPGPKSSTTEELQLALDVYKQVLMSQKENIEVPIQDADDEPQASSNIASTLIRMGSLYYKLGDVDEELKMYQEAKKVYENAYGKNHPYVAGTLKNIGMVLAERGEYESAMENFEEARRIYLDFNRDNEMNRDVASAVSCMGNVNNRMGELDSALDHYTQALRIYTSLREEEQATNIDSSADAFSADVAATLKIIGVVHSKKGDIKKATESFEAAIALLKSSKIDSTRTGKETTASILSRIAGLHFKKGEFDNAMKYYRQAYDLTVELRGTNHPEVASILHYIGGIHHKHRDYSEAMTCYQEAVRIYHSTLGTGNAAAAATLVCIGSIHYKQRNLDSAMMFYREALRLNRDTYGLHHPDVAPTLKSIGTILTKKGEYDEAYDVFRDVLSIKCTVHGTGHPEVANSYKSLGNVHYKRGELADAERQYRHALSIYRRTKGETHPGTASTRTSIEHIRYWMTERRQRDLAEKRNAKSSKRNSGNVESSDLRSC